MKPETQVQLKLNRHHQRWPAFLLLPGFSLLFAGALASAQTASIQLLSTALISESCTPTNGAIDPYETVSVNWTFTNSGGASTTNLIATLLTTNGIFNPSAAQTYGIIGVGSNATRTFTFTPAGNCGGAVTGLVSLVDGSTSFGTFSTVFNLGSISTSTVTQIFNNISNLTIVDNASAVPYPSVIAVTGVVTNVGVIKAIVTLNGWSHAYPDDVGMLLVGPGGQKVKIIGGVGADSRIVDRVVIFDDAASASLPAGTITNGTYLPTDLQPGEVFNAPAPVAPYSTTLAPLAATPNGNWSLYVEDFSPGDDGSISGGWSLKFITSTTTTNCCSTFPPPTLTSTTYNNNLVSFNWTSLPGLHYQVQFRSNLVVGAWQNLGTNILGTTTTMGITDDASNSPLRFYRVQVGP